MVDRGDLHLQLLDHPEQLEPQLLDAVADRAQGLRDTTQFGKPAEALPHLNRSLVLTGEIGDTLGQAGVHFVPALHWTHEKDDERALGHANSALELYRALGDPKWEARAFAMIGACHSRLGRHGKARTHAEAGLALCRERQDVYGEADALDSLAAIARETGDQSDALWRHLDNTYRQAGTFAAIGDAHRALDHLDEARDAWQRAIDIYRAHNLHPAADEIEKRSAELGLVRPAGDQRQGS